MEIERYAAVHNAEERSVFRAAQGRGSQAHAIVVRPPRSSAVASHAEPRHYQVAEEDGWRSWVLGLLMYRILYYFLNI